MHSYARSGRVLLPAVLGALAAGTAVPAWFLTGGGQSVAAVAASPTLGKAGALAEQIAGLAVTSWDEAGQHEVRFEVAKANGSWVIKSAFGYPADAQTRATRTATDLLGAQRGQLVSADRAQHADLEVLDPRKADGQKKGFGKAISLTDQSGATVLDVIVGASVPGSSGSYYVREAGSDEVWTAKIDPDISTKFIDYVETDPFKIARDDVRAMSVVEFSIDPDQGTMTPGSTTTVSRPAAGKDWTSAQAPEGKRPSPVEVGKIVDELNGLRLAGVRPFRLEWLGARGIYAGDAAKAASLPGALITEIQGKKIALFGTEGRLDVTVKDGLRYSFLFGKVALPDTVDTGEELPKADEKAPASTNRYLAVFVQYDEALDEVAKAEAAAAKPEDKDKAPAKRKAGGKERAAKAQARFQQFFYVITDANFKALRPELAKLWEDKPKEPMAGSTGKTNSQWLEENKAAPGITTTASGLQYRVMTSGPADGKHPGPGDTVQVAYKGTLLDGTVFDENADMSFGVSGVIKGWTEALQLMRPGDQWQLTIPPGLAYGEAGSPPKIGPNQILQFEVTLKAIK